jgi:hypothetical protein
MNERVRLETLVARDGQDAAREWARRTAALYRKSISDAAHFASQPDSKPRFEQLVRELERFAETGVIEPV